MPNKIIDIYNHSFGKHGFDYSQIDELVFIGTNMCCQFGFNRELLSKNVQADISLEKDKIDAPAGVSYFLWLPTENDRAPTPDALSLGVQVLEFLINRKIKVYIHCKNGHGRAPTLYIAYLIKSGMGIDEAINFLKSKRPSIHINAFQMEALNRFKDTIFSQ
ncbi:MAG: dual specificity protein phosphatase family protein [Candidatus Taylorbacteria bacterium]